jgi:hypothetical protein
VNKPVTTEENISIIFSMYKCMSISENNKNKFSQRKAKLQMAIPVNSIDV